MCLHSDAICTTRVAIHTRGNINADHRFAAFVDKLDNVGVQPANAACDACAEQRVYDGIGLRDRLLKICGRFEAQCLEA